ncbi:hypothetical protein BOX15_Mlig029287g1 [Macrostomum lignano]|uniref:Uncharacterized protein n=1 Tax=Macrostomum lignano TaxID=282301 RepID=A0A267FPV3_9PLAT|nr:hypothetical protein BOX15_Mlig029287g1 [Macrostomum lignano]
MRLKNVSTIFMTFLAAFCIQLDASSKLHLADDGYYNDLLVFVQISADGNVHDKQLDSRQVPFDLRYPVEFDVSARSNLVFSLFLPSDPAKVGSLRLMLRSPSGRTFNCSGGSSAICTVDAAVGSVTVQIPDAEVESGKWTLANLAVGLSRRIRRQAASNMHVVITGNPYHFFPKNSIIKVKPNKVKMVKYDTSISVVVHLLPRPLTRHQLYADVKSGNTEVARFCLLEQHGNSGTFIAKVPLYAVQKAGQYHVNVHITHPYSSERSAGTLTVQAEDPNFDRRRIVPETVTGIYKSNLNNASKKFEIKWNPVEDPSGLLTPKAEVPLYSIRYEKSGDSCTTSKGRSYYFCPELAVTNQSSANIYNQYIALNEPLMRVSVIAISAANVSSFSSKYLHIHARTISDYLPVDVDKKQWCGLNTTTSTSTPHNSLDPTVTQSLTNDPNKAKSTVDSTTKSSPRNSTQAKSSAQLNVDLSWLSAGTVCSLAVLTVSAQQWLIQ